MPQRIPHPESPVEVRKAFQHRAFTTDVLTTGTTGQLLIGQGVGVLPVWGAQSSVDHGSLGGLGDDDHVQYHTDVRAAVLHFLKTEHLAVSAGVADAGKPIKLDAAGHVDASMINDGDVDHGTVGGLGDDDHTIYLLAAGTRALTGNLAVDALVTIDGRDLSVDGVALDSCVAIEGKVGIDSGATPGYLGAAFNDGVLRTSTGISYADGGNFVTLTTNDGEIIHDNLSGYDANKHVDHTGVTLTAGSGIAGGGTIADSRTFDLDINSLSATGIAAGDFVPFWDITATATNKKITFANFEGTLDHGSLAGLDDADHDAVYYQESEHINISTGSGDAGKPIVLDATGRIDPTMAYASLGGGGIGGGGGGDGSGGGVSEDMGLVWAEAYSTALNVRAICYLGNGIVVAGGQNIPNGEMRRSLDYGETWTDLGVVGSDNIIVTLACLGSGIVIAGTYSSGKILRSTDYGENWTDLGQQHSCTSIECSCYLSGGIAVAGAGGGKILRSTDYGANWSDLGQQASEATIYSFCYLGDGIALAGTSSNAKILKSEDYGATWVDKGQLGGETRVYSLCYLGDGIAIAGTEGRIWRTVDYGENWSDLGVQAAQSAIQSLANLGGGIVIAGGYSGGLILRSTDYGATWTSLGNIYGSNVYSLCNAGEGVALAGLSNRIYRSAVFSTAGPGDFNYYPISDFIATSAGAADAGKPIVLDGDGHIDATMINDADVAHASTGGYDANEHIDHTGVSISTGLGLSGGGTIASTRTLTLDINGLAADSIAAGDSIAFYDTTGGACDKITFANFKTALVVGVVGIDSGATPGYLGAAAGDGALRTGVPLTYTDGGDFVTLDIDQTDYLPSMTNNNAGTVYKCHVVFCDDNDDFDLAQADGASTPEVIGVIESTSITAAAPGIIRTEGILTATTGQWDVAAGTSGGLTAGTEYYLSDADPGMLTATEPSLPGSTSVRVGIALSTTKLKLLIATAAPGEAAALPIITSNITLYVTTGGDDVTGDGTEGDPWATLTQALAWLSDKLISAAATVTIQIDDGTYVRTATDMLGHVNGDRINIVGENTYDITLASIASSTGSTGAWSIVLNVDDSSDAAIGDFLLIPYNISGGSLTETLCGCWEITGVSSGTPDTITITSTHRHTVAPSGAVSGTVTITKTILQYNGVGGLSITASALGLLDKLTLLGNGNGRGLAASAASAVTCGSNVGISSFDQNMLSASSSSIIAEYICVSNSTSWGINVHSAYVNIKYSSVTGNGSYGVVGFKAWIEAGEAVISGNASIGFIPTESSNSNCLNATITYNTYGIYVQINAYCYAFGATVVNNTTANYSPAANVLGNHESKIIT